jgi:hypothetical protein
MTGTPLFAYHPIAMVSCIVHIAMNVSITSYDSSYSGGNPQNGLTIYEGPSVFSMSLFSACLVRFTSLLGFAIYAIPRNGSKQMDNL